MTMDDDDGDDGYDGDGMVVMEVVMVMVTI